MTDEERFKKRIQEGPDGCWSWTGARNDRWAPVFEVKGPGGKPTSVRAQTWAFEHYLRPLREGQVVRTLCGAPHCLSPEHLLAVNRQVARTLDRDRCGRGHSLTDRNLLEGPNGRFCRTCHGLSESPPPARLLEVT